MTERIQANVCHLIDDLTRGGAQTLLYDIVRGTPDHLTITVCYLGTDDTLRGKFEELGIEVIGFDSQFRFDPRALTRLAGFFRNTNIDILHTHLAYAQTFGRIIGRLMGVDIIVSTYHDVPESYCRDRRMRVLETITRPLDSIAVGISEGVTQGFKERWYFANGGEFTTIYDGINVEEFARRVDTADPTEIRSEAGVSDDLVYLNVARYVPKKRQLDLIQAMREVVKEQPSSHLFLVGHGEFEETLQEHVRRFNLDKHVTVTGYVESVYEYYALADVFVLPSLYEGFGLVAVEAMAANLPVIATNVPGVSEVVDDAGILVPDQSPSRMAEAMLELRDAGKRAALADSGFERVSREFTIENTVESYCQLYDRLLRSS